MPAPLEGVLPAAVSAALIAWACLNAQRLVVRRLSVAARRIAQPLRLVQISDLHIGSRSPAFLRRVIERVNRLEPDLVLITGDVVDLGDITAAELAPIARLQAPSFFAIGNHERYIDCDAVCATFTAMGVTVLRDDIASAFGLQIVGIDDAENRGQVPLALAELGPRLDRDAYKILLYHRPDAFEAAAEAGIDLMLCGHTHNGQIVPFNWVVKHSFPRIVGRFEYRQATLYVSPGTGTWGPSMRLGSQNEISVIELSATDAPTSGE
jgi:predicted MPP superfamily phosphohydrolase